MTVVVVAAGSAGDVHPNVGLALALQRRGHAVVLVAAAVFENLARRVGLSFVGYGTEDEYSRILRDPDLWHPYRAFPLVARKLMIPLMRPIYDLIARHRQSGPLVVTASGLVLGARLAREKLGVPLVTVHLQPSMLRSVHEPAVLGHPDILGGLPRSLRGLYMRAVDRLVIDPLLTPELNGFRSELGLPPVRRIFDRWMHSPDQVVGFFPEWFAPPQPDWPPNLHLAGFPLYDESDTREMPIELERFLDHPTPPLVFTAGSAMAQGADFFRVSAEACRAMGRRGLLLTQFPDQLPGDLLGENLRHFSYVPFSRLLPRAAILVHHGGIGTVAQALAAGIPQLVVPMAHDQPDNAARIRRLGVGDMVRPGRYRPGIVLPKLARLLSSPEVAANCRHRASLLSAPTTLQRTSELVERCAG